LSTILHENFDGVTAPALPATFNYSSAAFITTVTNPWSAPNCLLSAPGGTQPSASTTVQDGNSGNSLLAFYTKALSSASSQLVDVFLRVTASPTDISAITGYNLRIGYGVDCGLYRRQGGAVTATLDTVAGMVLPVTGWCYVEFLCDVTASPKIQVSIQDKTGGGNDGLWLTHSNTWQVAKTTCLSSNDNVITGTQGYACWCPYASAPVTPLELDNFTWDTPSSVPLASGTPNTLRREPDQLNVTIQPTGGTPAYSYVWSWSLNSAGTSPTVFGGNNQSVTLTGLTAGATRYFSCTVTDTAAGTSTSAWVAGVTATKVGIWTGNSLGVGYPGVGITNGLYNLTNPVILGDNTGPICQTQGLLETAQPNVWCEYNKCYSSRPMSAVAGNPTSGGHTQIGDITADIAPLVARAVAAGCSKIVVGNFGEPGNDLYFNQAGSGEVAHAELSLTNFYAAIVALGGSPLVVCCSMPDRSNAVAPNNVNTRAQIVTVNTWERAPSGTIADLSGFADVGGDSRLTDATNSTYFATGVDGSPATHLTPDGYAVVAPYMRDALIAVNRNTPPPPPGGMEGGEIFLSGHYEITIKPIGQFF
jgi:hypothetical protein